MSDFSLTLVLQFKTSKIINDMAKVQIKSEKVTMHVCRNNVCRVADGGLLHDRLLTVGDIDAGDGGSRVEAAAL